MQHPLAVALSHHARSAAWLGRMTGKSRSYVTRVISGDRRPSPDFQRRAAEALAMPESLLFPAAAPQPVVEPV